MKKRKIAKTEHLQFNLLPYISLKDEVRIGNVLLWPFYHHKDQYIKDTSIRTQIEKFLKQYIDNSPERNPLSSLTMVSYKSPDNFRALRPIQTKEIRDAIIILCFSTILRNRSFGAFSSDDFQLLHQNFTPGDDGIATSSGSLIRTTNGGLKINEVFFATPLYINQGRNIIYNEEILKALERLQQDTKNQEFYRRVITALEWVAYSYTNVENFNYASRIVMMATAFEVLLDGFRDRWEFIKKIKKFTCNSLDEKKMRSVRIVKINNAEEEKDISFKEWWAYEFYNLRNKIVHGREVKNKDFKNRKRAQHFLLAIKFFEECLKKLLGEKGYYQYDSTDELVWAGIYSEI